MIPRQFTPAGSLALRLPAAIVLLAITCGAVSPVLAQTSSLSTYGLAPSVESKTVSFQREQGASARLIYCAARVTAKGTSAWTTVPAATTQATLEAYDAKAKRWESVLTSALSGSSRAVAVSFNIPSSSKGKRLRVLASIPIKLDARGKFPAKFFKGAKTFAGSAEETSSPAYGVGDIAIAYSASSKVATKDASTQAISVEESDIWKIEGNTIYLFNQLRGLQVIDATNPSDPVLAGHLRLPARGEDMYVGQTATGRKRALLLMRSDDASSWWSQNSVLASVDLTGADPAVSAVLPLEGSVVDSRLIGTKLVVATQRYYDANSSYAPVIRITSIDVSGDEALTELSHLEIGGWSAVVSATPSHVVVAVNPPDDWWNSNVVVVPLSQTSPELNAMPAVKVAGRIKDKFKMNVSNDGILTVVTEKIDRGSGWSWSPTTVVNTFSLAGGISPVALGSLEIAPGQSLFGTRFHGTRLYAVTFERIDPLHVIDLSDPAHPTELSQLEVPGYSTYLQPVGDYLVAVGVEGSKVAVSLFDVKDPTKTAAVSRLLLGSGDWSYSEANWDEKAVNVIPDAGLILVPVHSYGSSGSQTALQLIDLDVAQGQLTLRGEASHQVDPRRAGLLSNGAIASVSGSRLVVMDASERDAPAILADVRLAWPVDRVFCLGDYLLQIENGSTWAGSGSSSTLRISTSSDPEDIISELPLESAGRIEDAALFDGFLYIAQQVSDTTARVMDYPGAGTKGGSLLVSAVDVRQLPATSMAGSVRVESLPGTYGSRHTFCRPDAQSVAMLSVPGAGFARIMRPIAMSAIDGMVAYDMPSLARIWPGRSQGEGRLTTFNNLANGAPLAVLSSVAVCSSTARSYSAAFAADGAVLVGFDDRVGDERVIAGQSSTPFRLPKTPAQKAKIKSFVQRVDLTIPSSPSVGSPVDLPAPLKAVSLNDKAGALLACQTAPQYARSSETVVSLLAFDGNDASLVATKNIPGSANVALWNRSLFVAGGKSIERYDLTDSGTLAASGTLDLGWQATSLRVEGDWLTGAAHGKCFQVGLNPDSEARLVSWTVPRFQGDAATVARGTDQAAYAPVGEYGVERLSP